MDIYEAAEMIEKISEEICIKRLGYTPRIWYTSGSSHNDDRLTAIIEDGEIIVSDGNSTETYYGDLTEDAIREYVIDWLDAIQA